MNWLVGSLMLMFVLYVTIKGTLPKYLQLLIYQPPGAPASSDPSKGSLTAEEAAASMAKGGPLSFLGGAGLTPEKPSPRNPSGSPLLDLFGFDLFGRVPR